MKYVQWLRRGLALPGKSQAGLARHLKISEPVVSRMVSGDRRLRDVEIDQISTYFGFGPDKGEPARSGVVLAPVVSTVHEGFWREKGRSMRSEVRQLEIMPHPDFAGTDHYVVELGDVTPRSFYICIPISKLGRSPKVGDMLHAIRTKGDLEQEIVRQLERVGTQLVLLGDPAAAPISYTEVTVKGIAVSRQTLFQV